MTLSEEISRRLNHFGIILEQFLDILGNVLAILKTNWKYSFLESPMSSKTARKQIGQSDFLIKEIVVFCSFSGSLSNHFLTKF